MSSANDARFLCGTAGTVACSALISQEALTLAIYSITQSFARAFCVSMPGVIDDVVVGIIICRVLFLCAELEEEVARNDRLVRSCHGARRIEIPQGRVDKC
jgi:hypothetical protein